MRNDKMSFFEKLTGGVKIKNEDTPSYIKQQKQHEKSPVFAEQEEEAELAVDVHQTPTEIIITSMVAGVKPDDLQVSITREMVTIKGSREKSNEGEGDDYFYQELFWGSFSRSITLPEEIDPDNAEAIEKNGLLTIKLPKIIKEKQKVLKVRSL